VRARPTHRLDCADVGLLGADFVLRNVALRCNRVQQLLPAGLGLQLVRGRLGTLRISIPWTGLLSVPIQVRVSGLEVEIALVERQAVAGSVDASPSPARTPPTTPGPAASPPSASTSGPSWLQETLTTVLSNVALRIDDVSLRIVHRDEGAGLQHELLFTVGRVESWACLGDRDGHDGDATAPGPTAWAPAYLDLRSCGGRGQRAVSVRDVSLEASTTTPAAGVPSLVGGTPPKHARHALEQPLLSRTCAHLRMSLPLLRSMTPEASSAGLSSGDEASGHDEEAPADVWLRNGVDSRQAEDTGVVVDGVVDFIDVNVAPSQVGTLRAMLEAFAVALPPALQPPDPLLPAPAGEHDAAVPSARDMKAAAGSGDGSDEDNDARSPPPESGDGKGGGLLSWLWGGSGGKDDDVAAEVADDGAVSPALAPRRPPLLLRLAVLGASLTLQQWGTGALPLADDVNGTPSAVHSARPSRSGTGGADDASSLTSGMVGVDGAAGSPPLPTAAGPPERFMTPAPRRMVAVPVAGVGIVQVDMAGESEQPHTEPSVRADAPATASDISGGLSMFTPASVRHGPAGRSGKRGARPGWSPTPLFQISLAPTAMAVTVIDRAHLCKCGVCGPTWAGCRCARGPRKMKTAPAVPRRGTGKRCIESCKLTAAMQVQQPHRLPRRDMSRGYLPVQLRQLQRMCALSTCLHSSHSPMRRRRSLLPGGRGCFVPPPPRRVVQRPGSADGPVTAMHRLAPSRWLAAGQRRLSSHPMSPRRLRCMRMWRCAWRS